MGEYILGLHAGHNASASIGDKSGLIYAIQEERLCGEKNYWGFPKHAIQACLDYVGATKRDVLGMAYGGNQALCRYHSRDDVIYSYRRQESMLGRVRQRVAMPIWTALRTDFGQGKLREHLTEVGFGDVPLQYHNHHLTHGATAYYGLRTSPDKQYLVLTCDGAGDQQCATVRVMGGGKHELIAATHWGESLGAIYSWVTFGMGFIPLEHEYKLMGMAPYASEHGTEEVAKIFRKYLGISPDGLSFERKARWRMNDVYYSALEPDLRGVRFDYICAGLQKFTEEMLTQWTANAVKATGVQDVLVGGGVFMNVKANKKIAELPEVKSFQGFPSCGDETLSIGAYYLEAAQRFGDEAVPPIKHYYLGDEPKVEETRAALQKSGFYFEQPANMAETVAELLVAGHPVARCAGRMEFGARALGNRSILGDPKNQDLVRVINRMVKKRDFWMPFAPMVIEERQHEYLHNEKNLPSPYMMMTFDTRENFRDLIAAVHNADLTCRAQLLRRDQNPEMYDICKAFERRTGRAVILNTSFNLHGYPICRTAEDALFVLQNSGLEYLQVGEFLVHKNGPNSNGQNARAAAGATTT
ncbi:MAG: hypothetical protein K1X74_13925 [Pirellulales bacterium]|nr:hypothetical protein [Pirellulales bacterium]